MPKYHKSTNLKHQISIINGVSFTPKEIDILACILNGRGTKATATLLFISPKTVEAHIRNIMLKIECNSRESVISYMEKSPDLVFVKNHYFYILAQKDFKDNLQKITSIVEKMSLSCCLVFWSKHESKDSYIYQLREDLTAVGLKISFIKRDENATTKEILSTNIFVETDYIVYCIPNISNDKPNITNLISEDIKYLYNSFNDSEKLYFLSENNINLNVINSISIIPRCIEFTDQDVYYEAFYQLVNKINPSVLIEKSNNSSMITHFERSYKSFYSQNSVFKDGYKKENSLLNNETKKTTQKKIINNTALAIICLLVLFSILQHQNEKKHLLAEHKEITTQWLTLYEPHFNEAVTHASFYQLRGNVLDVDKASLISEKINRFSFELKKDLKSLSIKIDHIQNNFWILSPLNWVLRNKIIQFLEDYRTHMMIAISINKVAKYMRDENFSDTIKEIIEVAEKQIRIYLYREKYHKDSHNIIKHLLSIITNIKNVARRKIAEDKEISKKQYTTILNSIYNDLLTSIKEYDSLNFSTYIILHYICLLLAHEEINEYEKTRLYNQAESFLTHAAQIAPNESAILSAQGTHFMEKKEYGRALEAFNTSLYLNPNNVGVLHNRAELYLTMGENHNNIHYCKKAHIDAQKANSLKPHDCDILKLVVWSSIYAQDCITAKEQYNKVFKPLCITKRKDWDDMSAIRNESEKFLENKFSQTCKK